MPGGRTAVAVNSTPERSLFTRIGTVIGEHVPAKAEQLNRYASIRTGERLGMLLRGAGFAEVEVYSETRRFSFASFDDYFSGIEAGAGNPGQEYVKLSAACGAPCARMSGCRFLTKAAAGRLS